MKSETMKNKNCIVCGNDFVAKGKEKICSDKCRDVRKAEHAEANANKQRAVFQEARQLKPKKCHTPKCKNIVHKQLPDGREICRTCLAKHNVYGGVDKPSPTTKSYKPGAVYKGGFNRTSAREDAIRAYDEFQGRLDDLKHKKRKQFFAIKRSKGLNPASKAFRDFKRDAPRR